ncbi:hypothetical protein MRX96_014272 [Rhipicephalus microplus]
MHTRAPAFDSAREAATDKHRRFPWNHARAASECTETPMHRRGNSCHSAGSFPRVDGRDCATTQRGGLQPPVARASRPLQSRRAPSEALVLREIGEISFFLVRSQIGAALMMSVARQPISIRCCMTERHGDVCLHRMRDTPRCRLGPPGRDTPGRFPFGGPFAAEPALSP